MLEAKIEALTVTVAELIATLKAGAAVAPAATKPATKPAATEATKTEAPAAKTITYDDVKVPFLDLVKNAGRDAALAVLKPFGHENLKTVKPDQFAEVLAAIGKAAAEAKKTAEVA